MNDDQTTKRLAALEEQAAFADREREQLSESLVELGQKLIDAERRLQRVEARLDGVLERVGDMEDRGIEPPPHSAGPDISKEPL